MKLRARRAEDKGERTAAILKAGREIWSKRSCSDFTMGEVAAHAGVVKGTLYLYFAKKEDLLQAMFAEMVDDYLNQVEGALQKRSGKWTSLHIAQAFAGNLSGRETFLRLSSSLPEHRLTKTAVLIDRRLPLEHGESMRFLLRTFALLSGFAGRNDFDDALSAITVLADGMEKRR